VRALVLGLCFAGCVHPARPGAAAMKPAVLASPVADVCSPTRAREHLVASAGGWRLYAETGGQLQTLEHVGQRRPSEDELLALRSTVSDEILDPWIFSFGGACVGGPVSRSCLAAGVVPGTRSFHVARRLDDLFGPRHDDLCYEVQISDAAPIEVFGDDGSCLPSGFHGPLRAVRGNWRLYDASSGEGLLLEHVGEVLAIDETSVDGLRARLSSAIAWGPPINMLARGMCGDVHPRRGQCLALGLEPGTDPFRAAELLDRALGPAAANLCYGVWVVMGTPVFTGS